MALKHVSEVDTNFAVEADVKKDGLAFYDVAKPPFSVHGMRYENGKYRRMPETAARSVSEGVYVFHTQTAGGRVRFQTNSATVVILAEMPVVNRMSHGTLTGTAGFDMYVGERFIKTFVPPYEITNGYESEFQFDSSEWREITLHFPLYSEVEKLCIGIEETALLKAAEPYDRKTPIVYYGSSITQGGCASRPGNAYPNIISRRLNIDHINLGFSGSAKGESAMAEYIRGLDMSAFVYDYDFNAATVDELRKTHENMFRIIRESHPELPIVILPRPRFSPSAEDKERLAVIRQTYENAKANGDEHVYFLDGTALMAYAENDGTVDGTHPNDWGFASMARTLGDMLPHILIGGEYGEN